METENLTELQAIARVEAAHCHAFGMASIALPDGRELRYVNRGDTYDETLCSYDGRAWFWSDWGTELENAEREHYEETGEERCCYCGEMAECRESSGRNWSGYACQSCGGWDSDAICKCGAESTAESLCDDCGYRHCATCEDC